MSIRELETHSGADVFVQQLSTTAKHNVLQALVKAKYLLSAVPVAYTPDEIASIERTLQTNDGVMSEAEYFKACEEANRD